jgi:hypothetical protein
MNRRLVLLTILALAIAAAVGVTYSAASFTTASASGVTARAAAASDLVHLYSKTTDPDSGDRAGYANQYGTSTPCATGQDEGIAIDMGNMPHTWFGGTYTFTRVITLKTPATLPAGVTSVSVAVSTAADADTGRQPLANVGFAAIGGTGHTTPVTMSANQKVQLNLQVTIGIFWPWLYGSAYTPHITIIATYSGGPANYYVYDFPVHVGIA